MDGRSFVCCIALLLANPVLTHGADAPQLGFQPSASSSVTFASHAAVVGQQTDQTVEVRLSLKSRTRQGAEVLEEDDAELTRLRRRVVQVARVERGLSVAARVHYPQSVLTRPGESPTPDPINGKQYYCERRGEALHVMTGEGSVPNQAEFKMVSENMEMLGKPHPLAGYLNGKQVAVGEKLEVPPGIARELVGLSEDLGEVAKFELTLKAVGQVADRPCARFQADLEASRSDSSQLRLIVGGPMLIDASTCGVVASELSGPIGMSHSMPDPRGRLQVDSTGKLSLRMSSLVKASRARR